MVSAAVVVAIQMDRAKTVAAQEVDATHPLGQARVRPVKATTAALVPLETSAAAAEALGLLATTQRVRPAVLVALVLRRL